MELIHDLNSLPRFGQLEDGNSKFITKLQQYFLAGMTAKRTQIQLISPVQKIHLLSQLKKKKKKPQKEHRITHSVRSKPSDSPIKVMETLLYMIRN